MYLLPLFGAIIGWLSFEIILYFLFNRLLPLKQKTIKTEICKAIGLNLGNGNLLVEAFQKLDLEKEITPLLDIRLDHFIDDLKEQIPLGDIFLMDPLANKLKQKVKAAIIKSLPGIKNDISTKIGEKFDLIALIEKKVHGYDLGLLMQKIYWEHSLQFWKLKGVAAFIGLLIGCIEILLFMYVC